MQRAPACVLGTHRHIHVEVVGQSAGPQRGADMHVPGQRGGAAVSCDLGRGECIGAVVRAETAMLARDTHREQSGGMEIAIVLGRKAGLTVVLRGARREALRREVPHARDQVRLLAVEAKSTRIEDRCVGHARHRKTMVSGKWRQREVGGIAAVPASSVTPPPASQLPVPATARHGPARSPPRRAASARPRGFAGAPHRSCC
jgi:hypothetical protein